MSCYSVPKRLLHVICGGSAIWLGTTFCSPLAATDLRLPPALASVPDALAAPEQTAQQSIVPAASLEGEETTHWDTGPVAEDGLRESNHANQDEYCDEFYGKYDYSYDYTASEAPYLDNTVSEEAVAESEETSSADSDWSYRDTCCDEYAYDGFDAGASKDDETTGPQCNETDGLVDKPAASVYSNLEDTYEDFDYGDYGYDEMYAHDEPLDVEEEALARDEEEDNSYAFEDEYGPSEEWAADYGTDQASEDSYDYDNEYYDDYGYDYEDEYSNDAAEMSSLEEQAAEVAEMPVDEDADSNEDDDFSYDFDDYEMYYGYEDDGAEVAEGAAAAGQEIVEETATSHESEWEDYYYGDEYQYYHDEYEGDSQPVAEEMADSEPQAEEAWAEEYDYEYDNYEYDNYEYDANDYDMEGAYEVEAVTEDSTEMSEESYDYADPTDHYGYEYEMRNEWKGMEAEKEIEINLDLFAWQPTELLQDADCNLIRSIERLSGEPAAIRRACLNDYIEALGFEAIDLAYRYEDATDADVLTLADDLPGTAAFLASYRLVEQGQIGMDDAVVLLDGALSGLSLDWIEHVGRIAAPAEVLSASHPVVEAMAAAALHSVAGLEAIASAVSQRLSELPWTELSNRVEEVRAAFRPLGSDDAMTF